MESKEHIEVDMIDTIIERPIGFNIDNLSFYIYPPTLGKTYLLTMLFKELDADSNIISTNPYLEALRLCQMKKDIVCRILAYYTFNCRSDIFDNIKVNARAELFGKKLDIEELSTLFVIVLSNDNSELYIQHLGIDKERKERKRIAEIRENNRSITFGGNSVYGTLIDCACQRYGWTMDYVVWGISYANLKMLMSDTITTVYLNSDELKKLNIFDNKENINADDPRNEELIDKVLSD